MCMDCGCGSAHDDMGDPEAHITYERIKAAAEANGQSVQETLETIRYTAEQDRKAHPEEY
jgi:hypothetical protein